MLNIYLLTEKTTMKQKSLIIGSYATLILIGGVIGFVVAHSLISLIVSSLFALFLFVCSIFIWKGHSRAFQIAMMTVFCLFLFFSYRFLLTNKLAPAGIMSCISGALFVYLAATRKQMYKASL